MRSGPPLSTVVSRLQAIMEPLCASASGLPQGVTRQIEVSVGLAESLRLKAPSCLQQSPPLLAYFYAGAPA